MSGGEDDLWALRRLAEAQRLQGWMFSVLRPTAPGPMLEIGAGIGTFSTHLLEAGADPLLLLEPDAACAIKLRHRFGADARVEVAEEMLPGSAALRDRRAAFSYALCQNVLEHIEDDVASLTAVVDALAPGGELAVLVPAHPFLFGRLDRRFGHVRRYTGAGLRALVASAGAELVDLRSFNLLGVPGWLIAGRTGLVDITGQSLRVYEALARIWRPVEDAVLPPLGLSLVARGRKPA